MSNESTTSRARSGPLDDEIDLHRLFALLIDAKWLILGTTVLALLLGGLYATFATPIYKADALLQVEKKQGGMAGLEELSQAMGQEQSMAAEIAILRSRMVLGNVSEQLHADIVVRPDRDPWLGRFTAPDPVAPGVPRPLFAGYRDSETFVTVKQFIVPDNLRGRAFRLTADEQGHPQLRLGEKKVLGGPADQVLRSEDESIVLELGEWQPGSEALTLTRLTPLQAVGAIRSGLTVNEQGRDTGILNVGITGPDKERILAVLDAIAENYLLQNINRQAAEAEQSLEFLNKQLPELKAELTEAEEKLNAYRLESDSVDMEMETQSLLGRVVSMESKLNELKIKESEVSAKFTKEHPAYRTLLEQRRSLEQERDQLNRQIGQLPETQQQILRLMRDVEVNQQIYVGLLNRAQELRIMKASTVGNVRIIDDAVVYPAPVKPQKGLVTGLAGFLGLILSAGFVLGAGLLHRGIESPDQLEEQGIPVYAAVPLSEQQQKLDRIVAMMRRRKRSKHEPIPLLAVSDPADLAIEALRSLRTSLHFAMMEASNKVMMITGPSPEVGKSFISANLAAVLAQVGQKVLVIDADMRKGHLHRYFKNQNDVGLSDLLSGQAEHQQAIHGTEVENLHFIPRGQIPPNPSELLMHSRFKALMERLSAEYDLVLVDTPPILAVTDAAIIGQQAGTSLIVARYGMNSAKEVDVSVHRFEQNKVEIKGAILNAIERRASNEYGYYAYHYNSDKS
ncbi:MAG TPA: tyrosine-protein kinase [Alcanivorax sp.]|jgi:tyrosine-protein kinase Etk/Wzc|nr:tyrosine-protein kinase [Alcanivorax sp.]HAI25888.1 tyrosine-protein kinase [Alcanivorax sp.]HBP76968.1 tyrosine-protein kinase [Alcanivorax sp.]HBY49241.1 tyrosine-protein kinase [Alcanivorax sp.]|tara:strand:+ start:2989 stop:5199 length:2211 start_codon:yes stop_codon:yes gene_type:complete